ncbi:MAG: lysophospholipase [Spirochaetes bacterium]|nr:lysophospholipase [Spirochaetota bacterium]
MAGYLIENGLYSGKNAAKLYYSAWRSDKTKAVVILLHDLGGHSDRFSSIVSYFENRNLSFYAADFRGHGKSEGKRGDSEAVLTFVYDIKCLVNSISAKFPGLPVFLIGEGFGAMIALRYSLVYQRDISGLILISPMMKPSFSNSSLSLLGARIVSVFSDSFSFSTNVAPEHLTKDKTEIEKIKSDKLIHDRLSIRLFDELCKNSQFCLDRASDIRLPILILTGTADGLCDVSGVEELFAALGSSDKRFEKYDGLYHEIMNELEKERMKVLNDVKKWVQDKMSGSAQPKAESKPAPAVKPAAPSTAKPAAKKAVKKPAAKKVAKKAVKKVVKKAVKKTVKKGSK